MVTVFLLLFSVLIYCQNEKQLSATYQHHNHDAKEVYEVYLTADKLAAYSEFHKIGGKGTSVKDLSEVSIEIIIRNDSLVSNQYYLTPTEIVFKDFIFQDKQFKPVIVSEKMPSYDWKLEDEVMQIGGIQCHKALLSFRGRNYVFWYDPQTPCLFGPWKFFGLPGLIVKIESDDKKITFQLTKFSYTDKKDLKKPNSGQNISFDEYVNLQERTVSDFLTKLKARMPRGTTVTVKKEERNSIEKNYE